MSTARHFDAEPPEKLIAPAHPLLDSDLVFERDTSRGGVIYLASRPTRATSARPAPSRRPQTNPPVPPQEQQEEQMSPEAPAKRANRAGGVRHSSRRRVLAARTVGVIRGARTVGVVDDGLDDELGDTSWKTFAKRFSVLVGVVLLAGLIIQMSGLAIPLPLILLVAQVVLVVFGVLLWPHKPRT
jgi:hypothetical protein